MISDALITMSHGQYWHHFDVKFIQLFLLGIVVRVQVHRQVCLTALDSNSANKSSEYVKKIIFNNTLKCLLREL